MRILMTSLIAVTLSAPAYSAAEPTLAAAPVKMLTAAEATADIALMRRGLE